MSPLVWCLAALVSVVSAAEARKKVYISQFVDHPALVRTTQGIVDGLAKLGYVQGEKLDLRIESAQANASLASQIAIKFVNQSPDVLVGVATLSAQSLAKQAQKKRINLVFSSVTDPKSAGLVQSLAHPQNHTSGVSNFVALGPQLELFKTIQPSLKRLGFLYNPSEINSIILIERLKPVCAEYGITLVVQCALHTSEMAHAVNKLVKEVDAIFISNDSTALAALPVIISLSHKKKVPVYVSDTDAVALGALAALGPNQYQLGIQTAKIIARGLAGENVGEIAVEFPTVTELYLNAAAAQQLGLSFSPELKARAVQIIKAPQP